MDTQELWQTVLGEVELTVSRANFITWFRGTQIYSKEGGVVTISVPNGFVKEWLEDKYNLLIFKILRNNSPDIREIKFVIGKSAPKGDVSPQVMTAETTEEKQLDFQEFNLNKETNLNPRYTFDNFIVGSFNELAQAAGRAIVKRPGTLYNPLFIYGQVGLGKTHLLQAVGNALSKKYADKKVKYISSAVYASELVDAISKRYMETFKRKYSKVDTLIIDDIQFIAGKEKTQEEFFNTFNALYQDNKQIIISSDRPPRAIATLEERLRSRFEGGMIADISRPDVETRIAILKNKSKEKNSKVTDDMIDYIATHVQDNIRELEGALNRVVAYCEINNASPTIDIAEKILPQIIHTPQKTTSYKNIIKAVAGFYDISFEELINRCRKKELVRPRQITMYLLRNELKSSYPYIGEKLGGRDHTTVMYACQKIQKEVDNNNSLQHEINLIKERVYS